MRILGNRCGSESREASSLWRTANWRRLSGMAILAALCGFGAPGIRAQRTQFKPGWNVFSPQQDVNLGQMAAKLPTGGVQYPWEFHCVNDKAVNAFALPGGYVFVYRGAIEAADNEAQLAGVMAHELSHVAL